MFRRTQLPKNDETLLKRQQQNVASSRSVQVQPATSDTMPSVDASSLPMSPSGVLQLQRVAGNRAVDKLLQTGGGDQSDTSRQPLIQRTAEEDLEKEVDLLCPGSKIRSGGQGQGKGYGQGQGPIGVLKKDEWI